MSHAVVETYGCWGIEVRQHLVGFSPLATCYNLPKSPGHHQFVWETQIGPGEGKCFTTAVPLSVLSRHLLTLVALYCVLNY